MLTSALSQPRLLPVSVAQRSSMQELNILGNPLRELQPRAFDGCDALRVLYVGPGPRSSLDGAQAIIPHLQRDVMRNGDDNRGFAFLDTLQLENLGIETVDPDLFGEGVISSALPWWQNNALTRVPPIFSTAKTLVLTGNNIQSIEAGDLDYYPELLGIQISGSPMLRINTSAMDGLTALKNLSRAEVARGIDTGGGWHLKDPSQVGGFGGQFMGSGLFLNDAVAQCQVEYDSGTGKLSNWTCDQCVTSYAKNDSGWCVDACFRTLDQSRCAAHRFGHHRQPHRTRRAHRICS